VTSLIQQLQGSALDPGTSVSDLLRRAMVVARKLRVSEIQDWIDHELYGYRGAPVPDYRELGGELYGNYPHYGWVPLLIHDPQTVESYLIGAVSEPVSMIEKMAENSHIAGHRCRFPAEIEAKVQTLTNYNAPIRLVILSAHVTTILDAVRSRILDWALKLEEAGVKGDGISFSLQDEEKAHTIIITGNVGVIGDLSGSANVVAAGSLDQLIEAADLLQVIAAIRSHLSSVPKEKRSAAEQKLNELDAEVRQPKPDQSKLRSGLQAVGRIADQVRDKVIEAGVKALVDRALGGP
jgi:hypothetical protein